jgi:putative tryptophan/tyrosine transport system substrate-binding protein
MKRRHFLTLLGGAAAAWPLAARAQQGVRARRIGVMFGFSETDPLAKSRAEAFQQGLDRVGWTLGRNLAIDYRWSVYSNERAQAVAAELLTLSPDLILTMGTTALRAARQATRTIPIVFTIVYEPVAQGFVQSLAHPGGNITGFSNVEPSIGGKWLELLKEIAPAITRVAFIFNPEASPYSATIYRSTAAAAAKLTVDSLIVPVHEPAEIQRVVVMLAQEPNGGMIAGSDSYTIDNSKLIAELAARYRIPVIFGHRQYMTTGGLMYYGADLESQYRLAAGYVDRIFRGASPADLPVQEPTKFELIVNRKAAAELRLTVPQSILLSADDVIE